MDITPQNEQQPISDDQELAKALAGVLPDVPEPVAMDTSAADASMQFQPTPAAPALDPTLAPEEPEVPAFSLPQPTTTVAPLTTDTTGLDDIKKNALEELRPLIDRVDLPAEEKFDTYLMLIRSTDDSALIGPAHAAAQGIADETRRAEALLDIIKEIDYLSRGSQQPTA